MDDVCPGEGCPEPGMVAPVSVFRAAATKSPRLGAPTTALQCLSVLEAEVGVPVSAGLVPSEAFLLGL